MSDLVSLHNVMKKSLPRPVNHQRETVFKTVSHHISAPIGYAEQFADVAVSKQLSIISNDDLHFSLYGDQQGRAILARIGQRSRNVVFISPSHLKQCGIGEYGRYLSDQFRNLGETVRVLRTSSAAFDLGKEFLKNSLIIINHGPGLFDGLNPRLSQGESTMQLLQNLNQLAEEFGALPLFIHHSLIDTDHHLLFSRQQQIMNSNIPSVTFISSAGRNFFIPYVELGVSPVPLPPLDEDRDDDRDGRPEVVGFFGFFQYGGKDFDSLFHLTRELRARLVGSVATSNASELEKFEETLKKGNIDHELGSGWVTDVELLQRLDGADYFYLPQNDYDHWNNSATARFVTNLDRPLFLPPHHPFLDMADGSIFATAEDLPRIVAHFREPKQYDGAVQRVKKFRARAAMINTAKTIRDDLVPRLSDLGTLLLAGPVETSAERFLELDAPAQSNFAAALAAKSTDLADVMTQAGGFYRSVLPKQFWRKHYEIGDLLFPTLNDTLHAVFLALCKRHPSLTELITVVELLESEEKATDLDPSASYAKMVKAVVAMALAAKNTLMHDPNIVLLANGAPQDWGTALHPQAITSFLTAKAKAQNLIAASITHENGGTPKISNLVELLLLPPQTILQRDAGIDLSALDFVAIQSRPNLADRFNALVRAANAAGINLGAHFVMDRPQAPNIDHRTTCYAVEDFIFFEGDMFVLNAFRCLQKRDAFPLEVNFYTRMLLTMGQLATLKHLLARCDGRIHISNLDGCQTLYLVESFAVFIANMRDPMSGLIDTRNAYEILRRNNTRWWLANKTVVDKYWQDADTNIGLINLITAKLSVGSQPMQPAADTRQYLTPSGQIINISNPELLETLHQGSPLELCNIANLTPMNGFIGFHAPEPLGAWIDGAAGSITVRLANTFAPTAHKIPQLRLNMGFFGSAQLGPRKLTVDVKFQDDQTQEWHSYKTTVDVLVDSLHTIAVDCPKLKNPTTVIIQMALSQITSPANLGLSADVRMLGPRVISLELGSRS